MPRAPTRRDLEKLTADLDRELASPRLDWKARVRIWRALQKLELAGRSGRKRCCLVCRAEPLNVSPGFVRHAEGCEVGAAVRRALDAVEAPVRARGLGDK